jgi:hypothetical protein
VAALLLGTNRLAPLTPFSNDAFKASSLTRYRHQERCSHRVSAPSQQKGLVVSVLDDLRSMEQRVTERLAELEPLVQEYNELRVEAERFNLAISPNAAEPKPGPRARKSSRARTAKSAKTVKAPAERAKGTSGTGAPKGRAARSASRRPPTSRPGKRREQVLELVKANPGITVTELGQRLSVDSTSLYRHVNRLSSDGLISKTGRTLQPV